MTVPTLLQNEIKCDVTDERVESLFQQYNNGRIILNPDFQRYFVWNRVKASKLLESIMMGIPLGLMYLSRESDGNRYAVDGKQRLTSIFSYISGLWPETDQEFRLEGITQVNKELLEGKAFKDLPMILQNRILDTVLKVAAINEPYRPELKYEIFSRLNSTPTPLNAMELRNAAYQGPYLYLVKKLAALSEFKSAVPLTFHQKRDMNHEELVLRFMAFQNTPPESYRGPLKTFLDADMEQYRNADYAHFQDLEQKFLRGLTNSIIVFQNHAFYRFFAGSRPDPNGHWNKSVNKALCECVMWKMSQFETKYVSIAKDALREAFIVMMTTSDHFLENIEYRGGSYNTHMVRRRFEVIGNAFEEVMRKAEAQSFTLEKKQQYFEENSACKYCKNLIRMVDDATICNLPNYWLRFHPTVPLEFAHRFCSMRFSDT